jgi:hypothetical protein
LHSTAAILAATLRDLDGLSASRAKGSAKLRPIIVYGLSDARAAAQAAIEVEAPELVLLSPRGVAHSLGPRWFVELMASVGGLFPDVSMRGVLDCGPYEGHVMNALHIGMTDVYFHGDVTNGDKLAVLAEKTGAHIHQEFEAILDLKGEADPQAACRAWLASDDDLKGAGRFATQGA